MDSSGAASRQTSKTILVVDDDVNCSHQLTELLRCQGYDAVSVTSGVQALQFIERHGAPGLILLDLMMPEMGGIELMGRVHDLHPDVPICLITALYDEQLLRTAMRLGAYDCITKPMDAEYLKTTVLVAMFNDCHP